MLAKSSLETSPNVFPQRVHNSRNFNNVSIFSNQNHLCKPHTAILDQIFA